jgi:hypothetical protein
VQSLYRPVTSVSKFPHELHSLLTRSHAVRAGERGGRGSVSVKLDLFRLTTPLTYMAKSVRGRMRVRGDYRSLFL